MRAFRRVYDNHDDDGRDDIRPDDGPVEPMDDHFDAEAERIAGERDERW